MIAWLDLAGAILLLLAVVVGWALLRVAGRGDTRRASLAPTPSASAALLLADRWYLNGTLSVAGHSRLVVLIAAGGDAAPYWSGGEHIGTPCVWANRRRYTLSDWNTESDELDTARSHNGQGGAA